MDVWAISTFWPLWIMLLQMCVDKDLFEHLFSVLLVVYVGVELLGHMVIPSLAFWGTAKLPYCFTVQTLMIFFKESCWHPQTFCLTSFSCPFISEVQQGNLISRTRCSVMRHWKGCERKDQCCNGQGWKVKIIHSSIHSFIRSFVQKTFT